MAMFDNRSLDAFLSCSDQCLAVCSAYEQARAGEACLKTTQDADGKAMAEDAVAAYPKAVDTLKERIQTALSHSVTQEQIDALLVKLLPTNALPDVLEEVKT